MMGRMVAMRLEEALQRHFGFGAFRPTQDEIVQSVVEGRDVLVVMPTGGGKSICYQLPALLKEGVTVVVSPLIALMKDQVDALQARDIAATLINSSLSPSEQAARLAEMRQGRYKLVYVAPERFRDGRFTEALGQVEISFVAVDEAHCVSMWGHDFRPDYTRIGEAVARLGRPPVVALTATATPEVRDDIQKSLALRDPVEFVTGFERPNLSFQITDASKESEKLARLDAMINSHKKGIIYCATRKKVEEVAEHLRQWDVSHIAYHAGFDEGERSRLQDRFIRGEVDVAVATNAFGMGIDRADIRFVVHYQMPGSVEAYYQEAGRAGRDGLPAACELLFSMGDRHVQEFFNDGRNPPRELIEDVYRTIHEMSDGNNELRISIADLSEEMGDANGMAVGTALILLARANLIERFDISGSRVRGTRLVDPRTPLHKLPVDWAALMEKRDRDEAKLDAVVRFINSPECRQAWIMRYFGEKQAELCGRCDRCIANDPDSHRPPKEEEWLILQKALSGVARMSTRGGPEGWEARFGKNLVIDMLLGSQRQQIMENQLHKLTTHGLLKAYGSRYLRRLFEELLRAGLIRRTGGEYPMITLTNLGEKVMKREVEMRLSMPPMPGSAVESQERAKAVDFGSDRDQTFDQKLFEDLRRKRAELAHASGRKPFMIFPDATLREIATFKPVTKAEAEHMKGVGANKLHREMPKFFPIVAKHLKKATAEA